MDNPARTAQYLATIDARRLALRELLGRALPSDARFTWELGCGHGHFLTAYARAHPERLCVGIDIVGERIERANRKRDRARLSNLHFIQAEARLFLDALPEQARFSEAFVLFPDPWPKKRHHKHRVMQPAFLRTTALRAVPDARLYFRTDHQAYFDYATELLRAHPDWEIAAVDSPLPFEHETVFQSRATHFHSLTACLRRAISVPP